MLFLTATGTPLHYRHTAYLKEGYAYRKDKKTKKDALTLPKQEQYDIENIRRRMKDVNDYLCGTEDWLDFNCQIAKES